MKSTPRQRERRRLERAYSAFRAGELERRPECEVRLQLVEELTAQTFTAEAARVEAECRRRASTLHHRRMKSSQGALVSQINTVAACEPCHQWIHAHLTIGHEAGLIVREGDAEWDACGVSEA